jgi:hypothetical protein
MYVSVSLCSVRGQWRRQCVDKRDMRMALKGCFTDRQEEERGALARDPIGF